MSTDYTTAIVGVVGLIVVLTAMVGYILSRPNDTPSNGR